MDEEFVLYLVEILHTGNHGPEWDSKVGEKYDRKRNTYCQIVMFETSMGEKCLLIQHYDKPDMCDPPINRTFTTPFVDAWNADNYAFIRTINSIYKFKRLKKSY